jgi:hypothetical protein
VKTASSKKAGTQDFPNFQKEGTRDSAISKISKTANEIL